VPNDNALMYAAQDASDPLEEVDIGKLLHLLDFHYLHDLFIVEQDPRGTVVMWQLLADEGDIMTVLLLVVVDSSVC
jgi:hypothetical protein